MISPHKHTPKVTPQRARKLQTVLEQFSSLAILTHNNPDPDGICAAIILQKIAKNFGVRTKVFISGSISRSENRKMIEMLKVKLTPYEELAVLKHDGVASVDCQLGMGNFISPLKRTIDITFDHHSLTTATKVPRAKAREDIHSFREVILNVGATATLLIDYLLYFQIPLDEKIANAYVYALQAETKSFSRDTTAHDISAYKAILPYSNLRKISKISHARKPAEYFQALKKTLSSYKVTDRVAHCDYRRIDNLEFVHELAEVLVSLEGVDASVLAAKQGGVGRISARANNEKVDLGNAMKDAMAKLNNASGGGHPSMAAGIFYSNTAAAVDSFLEQYRHYLSLKKKKKTK